MAVDAQAGDGRRLLGKKVAAQIDQDPADLGSPPSPIPSEKLPRLDFSFTNPISQAMTARRHHYAPQCYLKGFTASREKRSSMWWTYAG
jgi:hypothetical protein